MTPLTVTTAYSDTVSDSQIISNEIHAVRVTNMRLEWHLVSKLMEVTTQWFEGQFVIFLKKIIFSSNKIQLSSHQIAW